MHLISLQTEIQIFFLSIQPKWHYFIERLLEQSFQVIEAGEIILADGTPQEYAIVSNSIRNVTICKDVYETMYGAVADCLLEAFNYMGKKTAKKIDKDLQLNYFFFFYLLILIINIVR